MSNEKSMPKTKKTTVKSAPKTADRNVKNVQKSMKTVNTIADVKSVARAAATKQAMEMKHAAEQKAEQSTRPENYAVDTVEEKAASAASTVRNAAYSMSRRYVLKKYEQRLSVKKRAYNVPKTADVTRSDNMILRFTEHNLPKMLDAKQPKMNGNTIKSISEKSISKQPVKTKEAYLSAHSEITQNGVKTKNMYMRTGKIIDDGLQADTVDKLTQSIKATEKNRVLKSHSRTELSVIPKTKEDVKREYAVKRMKAKVSENKAETITLNMNPISEKVLPADNIKENVQVDVSKPIGKIPVKTKENYINSIRTKPPKIIKPPYQKAPKQNPHTMTRAVQISSKAVRTKEKTAANVIKSNRNIFKPGYFVKHRAVKINHHTVKTQTHMAKKAARQTAKRAKEAARRSTQTTKETVKAVKTITAKLAQAAVKAARAIISAIAAGGAAAVAVVSIIIVIIIAAVAASPFGITISEEVNDAGTVPLSQIIAEYNMELTQETEDIELSVEHTESEVIDNRTDNNVVLAVFAAKLAGAEDDTADDVVVFDEIKAEKLKEFFRTANTVEYITEETDQDGGEEAHLSLVITITGKTKDELMDEYHLTERQREAVEILLENGDILTSSSHSLAITDEDVKSIIQGLPDSLPQRRKDVVKNAGSLVGKVNYFLGGKSSAIGWDSEWGTMKRVTAAGSPSLGTIRAYGLDCSGFVTWAFNNSGMGYAVGHGTYGQRAASVQVSAATVQAGDLAFLPSYSHVGIVVGRNTNGSILVIHCSSSANNVVVSTAESVGFTVFRRPNCY